MALTNAQVELIAGRGQIQSSVGTTPDDLMRRLKGSILKKAVAVMQANPGDLRRPWAESMFADPQPMAEKLLSALVAQFATTGPTTVDSILDVDDVAMDSAVANAIDALVIDPVQ